MKLTYAKKAWIALHIAEFFGVSVVLFATLDHLMGSRYFMPLSLMVSSLLMMRALHVAFEMAPAHSSTKIKRVIQ